MPPTTPRPFRVRTTPPLLYRETPDGVLLYLDPSFAPAPSLPNTYLLTTPCLVKGPAGWPVGIAGVVVAGDGSSVECVVKGFCADCGEADVPQACVTVSGTVTLMPEDLGVYTGLGLTGYGGFFSEVLTGGYSVALNFFSASVGFTCCVPEAEAPRDAYYSLDGGATWARAGDIGLLCDGFLLALPATCDGSQIEVLWELWTPGYGPEGVMPPEEVTPP